jgi:hypothetical protein
MCFSAFNAELGEPDAIARCNELGISLEDRQKMAYMFNQGWRTAFERLCDEEELAFVGIMNDGICLYAPEDEWEVGPRIRLRHEDGNDRSRPREPEHEEADHNPQPRQKQRIRNLDWTAQLTGEVIREG